MHHPWLNPLRAWLRAIVCLAAIVSGGAAAPSTRPNLLLVLTDDLGFSDLGCYGSEIATPTLDRLAAGGLRFSQFYNTAKCHSSRVSLLTGRWCRQAGDESLRRAVTLPEVLAPAGYFTAMVGKWHLQQQPTDFGFQRYFGHLSGATNYYRGDKTFRLNGAPWPVPGEGFYTTVANVDHALRFLGEAREAKKPWFLYVAFNAPHAPLQPLEADYRRYLGRYDRGWDAVRAERVERQNRSGLFGRAVIPSERPDHVPAWDALSPATRAWEARRMAAYAALIDRVDQELGRLVADLERAGELANTLILFFSDNGACPYDRRSTDRDAEPFKPGTTWSDSTGWAWARNSPFRYYKQNQFEGGIATPAIAHWPAGLKTSPGTIVHTPAHLVDVLPTLADVGGATVPAAWPGREPSPLAGVSLRPILQGGTLPVRPPIHFLFSSDRGLRDGDWKLVSFQSDPWELYNLAVDRTERHNVAAQHPEIVARLAQQWHTLTADVLGAPARERAPVAATAATPRRHREWSVFGAVTDGEVEVSARKKTAAKRGEGAAGVRARVGTKLKVEGGQWILQCTGDDPGLAINSLPAMADAGPYTLEFRLLSRAGGAGEIFWTTDAATALPRGGHLEYPVRHDGEWQTVKLVIPEVKRLFALRLDPCAGPGEVRLEQVRLRDAQGRVVQAWP